MSEDATCPLWMMTFGDCMSLLVTFFVMLIAFTNLEEAKLADMLGGMKGALGVTPDLRAVTPLLPPPVLETDFSRIRGQNEEKRMLSVDELSAVLPAAEMFVKRYSKVHAGGEQEFVVVRLLEEGLAILIYTQPLFLHGTADFLPGNEDLFREIAGFVEAFENEVRITCVSSSATAVESGKFKTPWGLGIERAIAVKTMLAANADIARDRFSIGSNVLDEVLESPGGSKALAPERVEILVVGSRMFHDVSPGNIIIRDRWR